MNWQAVVTNNGISLLKEALTGRTLTLTGADGGTGTVPAASLMAQTSLRNKKQALSIVGMTDTENGKQVKIQITSNGLSAGYTLNQVGVWAALEDADPILFAIFQDDTGVEIPSATDLPDFLMEFFAVIEHSQYAEIVVHVDPVASVTMATMEDALAEKEDLIRKAGEKRTLSEEVFVVLSEADDTKRISYADFLASQERYFNTKYRTAQQVNDAIAAYASTLRVEKVPFSIPVESWNENEGAPERRRYYADVENTKFTMDGFHDAILNDGSLDTASDCGMSPSAETPEEGKLRFYSQEIPAAAIVGTCYVFDGRTRSVPVTPGGSDPGSVTGDDYVLPVASASTLGGVKIGDGVNVEEDGTISVDEVGVVESAVENAIENVSETDDGANEMLDEVFNP